MIDTLANKKILHQFNKAAASYDSVTKVQRDIVDQLISTMPSSMGTETLIDLGCGTGYGLQQLGKRYQALRLYGVDIAPNMLHIAKAVSRARLLQANLENLPYPDASLDIVFSSSAIQWCDLNKTFSEIKRVLKPGGQFYISSFTQGTLDAWRTLWMSKKALKKQQRK